MRIDITRLRAKEAWEAVERINGNNDISNSDYLSLVRKFPSYIRDAGLGPSLAFLISKGKKHHHALFDQLKKRLKSQPLALNIPDNRDDVLRLILGESEGGFTQDNYRLASIEVISYLAWLKRLSEGKLDD